MAEFAALLVLFAIVVALLIDAGPIQPKWPSLLLPAVALSYTAGGLVAWVRRPANQLGAVMLGGAAAWLLAGLGRSGVPALIAIGQLSGAAFLAVIIHIVVAFPSGRLRDRRSRWLVYQAYFVAIVLQAPLYLFDARPPPYNVLQLADRHDLEQIGVWLQRAAGLAGVTAVVIELSRRVRTASPRQRRTLAPLYVYSIAAMLSVPLGLNVIRPLFDVDVLTVFLIQVILIGLIPAMFAISILRGGFARTADVEELGAWLGTADTERVPLQDALSKALGDPSVELLFASPDGSYLDRDGSRVTLPDADPDRAVVLIDLVQRRVGAIVYDSSLISEPDLVRSAGAVIALAIDRERLTANLRASREAVRESRVRIMEASDRERRRIARDLHDGLQARLLLIGVEADRAGASAVVDEIDEAIADLRRFVQGVMPALLVEQGLCAATRDLVDRLPLPTVLDLPHDTAALPGRVETVAFFVVSEALSNAVKHAAATKLSVRMQRRGDRLSLEVCDDGVGGATIDSGDGLRGIADRVDALGGQLRVESPPGHGTHIVAELPCAS